MTRPFEAVLDDPHCVRCGGSPAQLPTQEPRKFCDECAHAVAEAVLTIGRAVVLGSAS